MAKNDLAKLIQANVAPKTAEDEFVYAFFKTALEMNPSRKPTPGSFSPSSIGACERELYYRYTGVEPDIDIRLANQVGPFNSIMQNGSDRHERIQEVVMAMQSKGHDVQWIDVGEFVERTRPIGTKVLNQQGYETKLINEILELRFLCDGIIVYRGEYYILEIKTMYNGKWAKANMSRKPHEEHIPQAATYSLVLNINKILFLYEDRNMMGICPIVYEVTEEDKQLIVNKVTNVKNYVQLECVPPLCQDSSKCKYCRYKNQCAADGHTQSIEDISNG